MAPVGPAEVRIPSIAKQNDNDGRDDQADPVDTHYFPRVAALPLDFTVAWARQWGRMVTAN